MTHNHISLMKFQDIDKQMGLLQSYQQGHICESIQEVMAEMWRMYPDAVYQTRVQCEQLRDLSTGLSYTKSTSINKARKLGKEVASSKWDGESNGTHAEAMQGQHFSLALHTGIEPFSGWILWLILLYYLDTAKEVGFVATMMTQCNLDTENFGIANAQILLWQINDPALEVYVQHQWM
ncbi:hypothetical protein EDC04DRAFT_2608169 [Pisolithus marmoratus]|nr:hypothetical protein EDC04DRAFT_2608169 [Pisolithus marmoratus]